MATQFTILCVCTGNVCRSPAAEQLLAASFGEGVHVESAGTLALVGEPIAAPMAVLLKPIVGPRQFTARWLQLGMLRDADLVLTMSYDHTGSVVELCPQAVRRTFTLKEFARLVRAVDPTLVVGSTVQDRLAVIMPLAAAERRRVVDPEADAVADPFRRDDQAYAVAYGDIAAAVGDIAAAVRAPGATGLSRSILTKGHDNPDRAG